MVIEAEGHERRDLDAQDEQDRPLEEAVVDEGHARVEAEVEGEIPGERDEARIDDDLPDPVSVDESHQVWEARTGTADRIVSTTSSCLSGSMPAQSGKATSSAAARSVSGSEPGP